MPWTAEQILALAPDPASAKSGRELAAARKWKSLGADAAAVWGECQGSAKDPYQTRIDLSEPAFKCNCPSRKFPCKHGLGLFLLFAEQPAAFQAGDRPAWVKEWLDSRSARAEKKAVKQDEQAARDADPEVAAKRAAEQAKRAAQRADNVAAGAADCARWVRDVIRQGLASLRGKGYGFFETPAARLVDAQAPGLARLVRAMGGLAAGEGREEQILERLAGLHLLLESRNRLSELPPATASDVRTLIGFTQSQDELLKQPGLRDRWIVLGRRLIEEDKLRVQRCWLRGMSSGRAALSLHFAALAQKLDVSLVPGTVIDAELVFFPGAYPLRALVKARFGEPASAGALPGRATIDAVAAAFAEALSAVPWLEEFPAAIESVVPVRLGGHWFLRDSAGAVVRMPAGDDAWRLAAAGGGRPMTVFGEFDGELFVPLAAFAEGRYVRCREFAGETVAADA
jgi:hypothetical protein